MAQVKTLLRTIQSPRNSRRRGFVPEQSLMGRYELD